MFPLFRVSGAAINAELVKIIMIIVLLLKHQFSVAMCLFIKLYQFGHKYQLTWNIIILLQIIQVVLHVCGQGNLITTV